MQFRRVMLLLANLRVIYKLYRSVLVFSPALITEISVSIAIYWIKKKNNKLSTFVRYQ